MKNNILIISLSSLLLASCVCNNTVTEPVSPESLLESSYEKVSVKLSSENDISELGIWVGSENRPSRVVLSCNSANSLCAKAISLLKSHNITYKYVHHSHLHNVDLFYDRSIAKDCSLIDNNFTLGCSVSANTVEMVSDKKQFTTPNTTGAFDAETLIKNINK